MRCLTAGVKRKCPDKWRPQITEPLGQWLWYIANGVCKMIQYTVILYSRPLRKTTFNWKTVCDSFTLTYLLRVGPRIHLRSPLSPTRHGNRQHSTYACPETKCPRINKTSTSKNESFPSSKSTPTAQKRSREARIRRYGHLQRPEPYSMQNDM